MKTVEIKGLTVRACHGVLPEEKERPQKFVIDISLEYDAYSAAQSDDISLAVDYGEVCALACEIAAKGGCNLIETLAQRIAFAVAERFAPVAVAEVTVHKPQAPVGLPFEDIAATARTERVKAVLSLGGNLGDRKATLDGAVAALNRVEGVRVLRVSDDIATPPYGGVAEGEFLNRAVLVECLLSARRLLNALHQIENSFGRVRKERWGDRTLDIDIVFFGNRIIAEEGLAVPHPDYANRDFVLEPMKQIVPDWVCPVRRMRVADMKTPPRS